MGLSYSAKVYKHSEMWNMDDRAFRIMIPLQIPRKLDPVLYVWSNSDSEGEEDEVIAGLSYDYHFVQVIGDGLLHSTLPCNYRERSRYLQMMATIYVDDINRYNTGYIYD